MRQFRAISAGHAEADRLREAQLVGAVRVAVNGSAEDVARYLDNPAAAGGRGDFDSPEEIIARWAEEETPAP